MALKIQLNNTVFLLNPYFYLPVCCYMDGGWRCLGTVWLQEAFGFFFFSCFKMFLILIYILCICVDHDTTLYASLPFQAYCVMTGKPAMTKTDWLHPLAKGCLSPMRPLYKATYSSYGIPRNKSIIKHKETHMEKSNVGE